MNFSDRSRSRPDKKEESFNRSGIDLRNYWSSAVTIPYFWPRLVSTVRQPVYPSSRQPGKNFPVRHEPPLGHRRSSLQWPLILVGRKATTITGKRSPSPKTLAQPEQSSVLVSKIVPASPRSFPNSPRVIPYATKVNKNLLTASSGVKMNARSSPRTQDRLSAEVHPLPRIKASKDVEALAQTGHEDRLTVDRSRRDSLDLPGFKGVTKIRLTSGQQKSAGDESDRSGINWNRFSVLKPITVSEQSTSSKEPVHSTVTEQDQSAVKEQDQSAVTEPDESATAEEPVQSDDVRIDLEENTSELDQRSRKVTKNGMQRKPRSTLNIYVPRVDVTAASPESDAEDQRSLDSLASPTHSTDSGDI